MRPARGRARTAALGAVATAVALAVGEAVAVALDGAEPPLLAAGDLAISLQPRGAKRDVVDLFGQADKLVLGIVLAALALALGAFVGTLGPERRRRAAAAVAWAVALAVALDDALARTLPTTAAWLLAGLAGALVWRAGRGSPTGAGMPDWSRRRFLGAALAAGGAAVAAGGLSRRALERAAAAPALNLGPLPTVRVPALPPGARLDVPGLTPLVTPNERFYRIDTALLVPRPDLEHWRLRVTGLVERPFSLTYAQLTALPLQARYVTLACVSNEVGGDLVGTAVWIGVPLGALLERAGVQPGAGQVVGRSVDGFTCGFPTELGLDPARGALVAVGMNGQRLPRPHGFPARLIVPGLFGYSSATKWLTELELTRLEDFDAYWTRLGYAKQAPILTQSRIDTPRYAQRVATGPVTVAGIAWAPTRGIASVELQVDDGPFRPARLSTPVSDATWVQWTAVWDARGAGQHRLRVRATDGTGAVQSATPSPPEPDGARGLHTVYTFVRD